VKRKTRENEKAHSKIVGKKRTKKSEATKAYNL
jgi:hypothetical protein